MPADSIFRGRRRQEYCSQGWSVCAGIDQRGERQPPLRPGPSILRRLAARCSLLVLLSSRCSLVALLVVGHARSRFRIDHAFLLKLDSFWMVLLVKERSRGGGSGLTLFLVLIIDVRILGYQDVPSSASCRSTNRHQPAAPTLRQEASSCMLKV